MVLNQTQKIPKRVFQFVVKPIRPLFDDHVGLVRSGPARGMKRIGGFSFIPSPRTIEEKFLEKLDLRYRTIYDIGANIGIMSLFFGRAAGFGGKVYAFEPNPKSISIIEEHLTINNLENVQVHEIAVGCNRGKDTLIVHRGRRGSGTLNEKIKSKFEAGGNNQYYEVEVFPLDEYVKVKRLPTPDFVKIDTEGYEYQCLLGMEEILSRHHPDLYIEMHGATLEEKINNAQQIVQHLKSNDYEIFNVQLHKAIGYPNFEEAMSGHLYCKLISQSQWLISSK